MEDEKRITRRKLLLNVPVMIAGSLASAWGFEELAKNPKLYGLPPSEKEKNKTMQALRNEKGPLYVLSVYVSSILGLFSFIAAAANLFESEPTKSPQPEGRKN